MGRSGANANTKMNNNDAGGRKLIRFVNYAPDSMDGSEEEDPGEVVESIREDPLGEVELVEADVVMAAMESNEAKLGGADVVMAAMDSGEVELGEADVVMAAMESGEAGVVMAAMESGKVELEEVELGEADAVMVAMESGKVELGEAGVVMAVMESSEVELSEADALMAAMESGKVELEKVELGEVEVGEASEDKDAAQVLLHLASLPEDVFTSSSIMHDAFMTVGPLLIPAYFGARTPDVREAAMTIDMIRRGKKYVEDDDIMLPDDKVEEILRLQ